MSEHDIADCPKCKQRDYILKDDDVWICPNCGHMSKMPKSKFDHQDSPNAFNTFIAVLLISVVLMIVLGNGRLAIAPGQDNIRELPQQNFQ